MAARSLSRHGNHLASNLIGSEGMERATEEAEKLRIFIIYSREDLDFADQLAAALATYGFPTLLDRHELIEGEDWKRRLGHWIADSDTIVFVLSPASARSDICAFEVDEAARLGKRVIPVVHRPLQGAQPPPFLSALNYIFFYSEPKALGSGFGQGLSQLVDALNTDTAWIREHTRFLQRAVEWDDAGRSEDRLLSGPDLARAVAWLARHPKQAPEPTALHFEFIRAGQAYEKTRVSAERQRLTEVESLQAAREAALMQAEKALKEAADLKTKLDAIRKKPGRCVFVSYRRSDSQVYAGRISDWLVWGGLRRRIFMDVDTIQKGRDFVEVLNDYVGQCGVMLVLIGHRWLSATDESGRRRLDDPEDFVRREVSTALTRGVTVIPVLLDGAQMPTADQLPNELKPLARHQSFSLNHEYFSRDIRDLQTRIKRDLGSTSYKRALLAGFVIALIVISLYPLIDPSARTWMQIVLAKLSSLR
jgi:hypothetical protein